MGRFMLENLVYVREMVRLHSDDLYWRHVGLIHRQLDGMWEGYKASAPEVQQYKIVRVQVIAPRGIHRVTCMRLYWHVCTYVCMYV